MRVTTETLSQMTNLLAVVSAPSLQTRATIRHVEVLALQPQVVLVVIITSTGGVSKMLATFERPGRPGLVALGRRVPQRAARSGSGSARGCSTSASPTPSSVGTRAGVPRAPRAGVRGARQRGARTRSTSRAPRACSPTGSSRTSARSTS